MLRRVDISFLSSFWNSIGRCSVHELFKTSRAAWELVEVLCRLDLTVTRKLAWSLGLQRSRAVFPVHLLFWINTGLVNEIIVFLILNRNVQIIRLFRPYSPLLFILHLLRGKVTFTLNAFWYRVIPAKSSTFPIYLLGFLRSRTVLWIFFVSLFVSSEFCRLYLDFFHCI